MYKTKQIMKNIISKIPASNLQTVNECIVINPNIVNKANWIDMSSKLDDVLHFQKDCELLINVCPINGIDVCTLVIPCWLQRGDNYIPYLLPVKHLTRVDHSFTAFKSPVEIATYLQNRVLKVEYFVSIDKYIMKQTVQGFQKEIVGLKKVPVYSLMNDKCNSSLPDLNLYLKY